MVWISIKNAVLVVSVATLCSAVEVDAGLLDWQKAGSERSSIYVDYGTSAIFVKKQNVQWERTALSAYQKKALYWIPFNVFVAVLAGWKFPDEMPVVHETHTEPWTYIIEQKQQQQRQQQQQQQQELTQESQPSLMWVAFMSFFAAGSFVALLIVLFERPSAVELNLDLESPASALPTPNNRAKPGASGRQVVLIDFARAMQDPDLSESSESCVERLHFQRPQIQRGNVSSVPCEHFCLTRLTTARSTISDSDVGELVGEIEHHDQQGSRRNFENTLGLRSGSPTSLHQVRQSTV